MNCASKCPGLPGWECGRPYIGGIAPECTVHGTKDQIDARWANHGKCKADFGVDAVTPVATPRDLVLALQGSLFE